MKKALKVLLVGLSMVGLANRAGAAASLTIYDGVNPLISVVDNGPGDSSVLPGAIFVSTNVGVWTLNISSAITKPIYGSATDPVMDINVQAISTAAGSLSYVFSDTDFGPASGTLNAALSGSTYFGSATATYDVYGDPANVRGATTVHIASAGTSVLPVLANGSGPLGLGAPFSLSQLVELNASRSTFLNIDASFNVTPVPEPGCAALALLGLSACFLKNFRRR